MKKRLISIATAAFLVAVAIDPAAAQGRGRGRGRGEGNQGNEDKKESDKHVTVVFRDSDRVTFHDYFTAHNVAPQSLPPGIAKKIARGKPLPPGIAKKVVPSDLIVLAPRQPGVTYYIVGDRVVAVRRGTVIDVLLDIFK